MGATAADYEPAMGVSVLDKAHWGSGFSMKATPAWLSVQGAVADPTLNAPLHGGFLTLAPIGRALPELDRLCARAKEADTAEFRRARLDGVRRAGVPMDAEGAEKQAKKVAKEVGKGLAKATKTHTKWSGKQQQRVQRNIGQRAVAEAKAARKAAEKALKRAEKAAAKAAAKAAKEAEKAKGGKQSRSRSRMRTPARSRSRSRGKKK